MFALLPPGYFDVTGGIRSGVGVDTFFTDVCRPLRASSLVVLALFVVLTLVLGQPTLRIRRWTGIGEIKPFWIALSTFFNFLFELHYLLSLLVLLADGEVDVVLEGLQKVHISDFVWFVETLHEFLAPIDVAVVKAYFCQQ